MSFEITDESQIIKKDEMIQILVEYKSLLNDLKKIGNKISEQIAEKFNKKNLYVDGVTVDKKVIEVGSYITQSVDQINANVDSTIEIIKKEYERQWAEYRRYLDYLSELEQQNQE